ncbi:hypothetical protein NLI96_g7785 [Meripilus lineatus]|uniref:Uncharacterized protein n=1 Tax=Meripilus lineatus TaxID=2056292 RepID=A0AAD5V3Q3_9APHY|nr:hypothetical protein NLI96_g7785 [Physisporinus lineatus]
MNPNTDALGAAGQRGHILEPAINDPPASSKISPTKEVPATRRAINKLTQSFRGIQALAKKVQNLSQPSSEKRALALVEQVITSQPQSCAAQVEILALRGPQAEQCVDLMQKASPLPPGVDKLSQSSHHG